MDIIIYTTKKVLEHKLKDGRRIDYAYCYWKLNCIPKKIQEILDNYNPSKSPRMGYSVDKLLGCGSYARLDNVGMKRVTDLRPHDLKLYVAINKGIVGFFPMVTIAEVSEGKGVQIRFHSDEWQYLKEAIPCNPFQGFKYYKEK